MSDMQITKTNENRYLAEIKDRIEEDVNDIQLWGMIEGRTLGVTWQEIINCLDQKQIGYKIAVPYN